MGLTTDELRQIKAALEDGLAGTLDARDEYQTFNNPDPFRESIKRLREAIELIDRELNKE